MRARIHFICFVCQKLFFRRNILTYAPTRAVPAGETGLPLVCPVEGRLPLRAAEDSDEEADVGISHGGSAVCGCGEPNAASLAGLAAAALGLDELWPLMLPGALLPAVTFNTVGSLTA
jgi:hypothetical protein